MDEAAKKLQIGDARGVPAGERLAALEAGEEAPKRSMLLKMAKQYRRPLLTFYMSAPPRKGDRGQDFRTLPEGHSGKADALLDALIRDVKARQEMVKAVLEDERDMAALPFIGSCSMAEGPVNVLTSIRETIGVTLADYRAQSSSERAFALLRAGAESAGVFVLLVGNLGNYHTAIDLETFRGLALADPIAPFIVINDQDAKPAWSFTLLHELAHLWLGMTGVSGASAEARVEQFCNEVAGEYLFPANEIAGLRIDDRVDFDTTKRRIGEFAKDRHLSRSMVAYKLFRAGNISHEKWSRLTAVFREEWLRGKVAEKEAREENEGGVNYYVVRRHRLGRALLDFVKRTLSGRLPYAGQGRESAWRQTEERRTAPRRDIVLPHQSRGVGRLALVLYLIDSSVLITAKNTYYPIDRVPEFWSWLRHNGNEGYVKIPLEIWEEIEDGPKDGDKDALLAWLQEDGCKEALLLEEEADIDLVRRVTDEGYAVDLTDDEIEQMGRDPFLIAYAFAAPAERCVVTTEVSRPGRQRQNRHIPDVCNTLGIPCCDTFQLIRTLGFSTSWQP